MQYYPIFGIWLSSWLGDICLRIDAGQIYWSHIEMCATCVPDQNVYSNFCSHFSLGCLKCLA